MQKTVNLAKVKTLVLDEADREELITDAICVM
jgi:hypothetical protein